VSEMLVTAMLALLLAAAWRDVITRTIPDTISVLLLAAGGFGQFHNGVLAIAASAVTALLLFALLFVLFTRGLLGGGDVKLLTALAVGLAPYDCYRLVVATALSGGLLAIGYLLLSRLKRRQYTITRRSLFHRILAVERWRIRRHGPLPYAVAIAAGGAFVLL
jgi:prepilin peptidase CpaA